MRGFVPDETGLKSISQVKYRLKKSSALSTERLKARSGPNAGLIFEPTLI